MHKKIVPNRYLSPSALRDIGLLDEVTIFVNRVGWSDFITMQSPTYVRATFEFLSTYAFYEQSTMLPF